MRLDDAELGARFLRSLPRDITSSLDPKVVLASLAAGTNRILNATRCSVVRVDPERHPGRGFVFTAVDDPAIEGYSLDLESYPEIELALSENRPIRVRDEPGDSVADLIRARHRTLPFPLSIVLPISYREHRFGVLFLRFADPSLTVGDEALALCQMIAFAAAIALNSAREYEVLVAEVNQREHQAEQLREALRLRVEVLSAASHDLRTPLNSIVGYLDLLVEGSYGAVAPAQSEVLAHVTRNALSLIEVVNSLLDHAHLDAGKAQISVARGEISRLLEELRLMIDPLVARRPVRVDFTSAGKLPEIETDWLKLKRILLNLLHNALKFTDRGEVTLRVSSAGERVRFEVADTGCGITAEDLPQIFNPFHRGNATRAEGPGGLGLAIVKRYVELLQGEIRVSSRPGEGATFAVELPVAWAKEGDVAALTE